MTGVVQRIALAVGWRRQLARMRLCLAVAATSSATSAFSGISGLGFGGGITTGFC